MELDEYRNRYGDNDPSGSNSSPGWDAIDNHLKQVYPTQQPKHWGTLIKYGLGGPDPIDGISAYECTDGGRNHLHFCTFGFSSLYYDENAVGGDFSRFGFELTLRLACTLPVMEDPIWVCNLLQNLGRYVFESGKWFEQYHWIPANGPLHGGTDTDLVGLAFVNDPVLGSIETPHGRVEFLQCFGITQNELDSLKSSRHTSEAIIEYHRASNPLLITDMFRQNVPFGGK